jgi:hypothetical protein
MLERYELVGAEDTPKVVLDANLMEFEISGKSMPEDATKFYDPIKEWLTEYVKNPAASTELVCKIDYFNSSSSRKFVELLIILETIKDENLLIKWYYDKDDRLMENKGRELESLFRIPFKHIAFE